MCAEANVRILKKIDTAFSKSRHFSTFANLGQFGTELSKIEPLWRRLVL